MTSIYLRSASVGIGITIALLPIPGYVANILQKMQKERLKRVGSHLLLLLKADGLVSHLGFVDGRKSASGLRGCYRLAHDQTLWMGKEDVRASTKSARRRA